MTQEEWKALELLLTEIIHVQEEKVLGSAERILPGLTREDLLQPNDFPQLENHPHFRYEEGVLDGVQTVAMALRAWQRDLVK